MCNTAIRPLHARTKSKLQGDTDLIKRGSQVWSDVCTEYRDLVGFIQQRQTFSAFLSHGVVFQISDKT